MKNYTPETIRYIQERWNRGIPGPEIAANIGTEYPNLKAAVDRLKRKGYQFASRSHPIGTVMEYKQGDGTVKRIKTETGWRYISSSGRTYQATDAARERDRIRKKRDRSEGPVKPKQPQTKTTAVRIVTKSMKKAPKPQPKPIKRTAMTDLEKLAAGWQWIWINSKTKVLRSPDKLAS